MKRFAMGVVWFLAIWWVPPLIFGWALHGAAQEVLPQAADRSAVEYATGMRMGPISLLLGLIVAVWGTRGGWLPGTKRTSDPPPVVMPTRERFSGWRRLWIAVSIVWGVVAAGLVASYADPTANPSESPFLAWFVIWTIPSLLLLGLGYLFVWVRAGFQSAGRQDEPPPA